MSENFLLYLSLGVICFFGIFVSIIVGQILWAVGRAIIEVRAVTRK